MNYKPSSINVKSPARRALPLLIILALGLLFRLDQWIDARDLMIDEANLMSNIYEKSWGELLFPLDYDQFAPLGFLWMMKAVTFLGPATEFHLRALSIGISVVSLLGFAWLVYRLTGPVIALWPVAAMSLGAMFLRYAAEIKQYGLDMAVTIALIWLFTKWEKNRTPRNFSFLILAGVWAIFLSMPSVFVLAGIGAAILFMEREKFLRPGILWSLIVWPIAFLVNYTLFLKPGVTDDGLQNFHTSYFLGSDMTQNLKLIHTLIYSTTGHTVLAITGGWLLFLAGMIYLFRRKKGLFIAFLLTLLCPLIASLFHKYSLIPRLLIFAFPVILLVQAFAFQWISEKKARFTLPAVLLWCLLILPSTGKWELLPGKLTIDEFRQPLQLLAEAKNEPVYIHHHAVPGVRFYTRHAEGKEAWQDLDLRIGKWEDWMDGSLPVGPGSGIRYLLLVHIGPEEKKALLERITAQRTWEIWWENKQGDAVLYFP